LIVLDANNVPDAKIAKEVLSHDGIPGAYFIDDAQRAWLAKDLAAAREKTKIVFCHQELHHTPPEGSSEGGDVPFRPVGKPGSFVGNGWQLREMLRADGRVLACFFGHRHQSRWTVHGGVHYITLAATHAGGSYAKVTVADKLYVQGHANQKSYTLALPEMLKEKRR